MYRGDDLPGLILTTADGGYDINLIATFNDRIAVARARHEVAINGTGDFFIGKAPLKQGLLQRLIAL